ncbi:MULTISPECIES: YqhR family membrane protein [Gracilibacillus]|uniref:YqhR family membrane protein n=1 Tax=Gracilibacillus TaxID=74385 RepID=UPI0008241A9C|nr:MULTISPECIES: YqhR family membrane protein [Gracilibacillus]
MRRIQHKEQQNQKTNMITKTISAGFFGAIIWGTLASLAGFFNFTAISPKSLMLRSWLQQAWADRWLGDIVSVLLLSVPSILVAFVYYALLKKYNGMLPGFIMGFVLWFLVFWLMNPLFSNIKPFYQLDSNTILTTMCLFVLYSVFIGYSISFAYHQHKNEQS